jgi:hypothetical protein
VEYLEVQASMKKLLTVVTGTIILILIFQIYWPSQLDPAFVVYGQTGGTPPSTISQIVPSFTTAGASDVTITLTGFLFPRSPRVQMSITNTMDVDLKVISATSTTITAIIPAVHLKSEGEFPIIVIPPLGVTGYGSNRLRFTVFPGLPAIIGMIPASGSPGSTFIARVTGQRLAGILSVGLGGGVSSTLLPGGTANEFLVRISIAHDAVPGPRLLSIATSTTSVFPDRFSVQAGKVSREPSRIPLPIAEVEGASVRTGYAVVITESPAAAAVTPTLTIGSVQNGAVVFQTTIAPAPATRSASVAFAQAPDINRNFGIAVVNTSANQNQITLTALDNSGTVVTNPVTLVLGPFKQTSRFLSELFPSGALGSSVSGSLTVQGSNPFAAVALQFNGFSFSPGVFSLHGEERLVVPSGLAGASPDTAPAVFVFPQFALGRGWASQLNLIESAGVATRGRIAFFDSEGLPLAVRLNGELKSEFSYSIAAGGSFLLAPRDQNNQTPF